MVSGRSFSLPKRQGEMESAVQKRLFRFLANKTERKNQFMSGLHKFRSLIGQHGRKNLFVRFAAKEILFVRNPPKQFLQ